MSRRSFGNIKVLMHFDFPYLNEPNEGLETVTRNDGGFSPGDKKFGYRAFISSPGSYIGISNNHDTFSLNPDKKYEAEAFIKLNSAPDEDERFDILRSDDLALTIDSRLQVNISIPVWNVDASSFDDVLTSNTEIWHHVLLRIANREIKVFVDTSIVLIAVIDGNSALSADDFRIGGFGNGSEGSVSIDTICVLNSSAAIDAVSDSHSFHVSAWNNGMFPPNVGSEIMILVHSPLTAYSELGLYDFARIKSINENNNIVLDRDINNEFSLDNQLLETYNIYVFTVPNFINLTINSAVYPPIGGVIAFRCSGDCSVNGSVISMGYGPTHYDLHQMMNSKLIDRFLISAGGGIFITCNGTFSASENARIGASWSGLGENGNGACGYGGNGDNATRGSTKAYGGSGGVGGGGTGFCYIDCEKQVTSND